MVSQADFDAAAKHAEALNAKATQDEMLQVYGLFKQSSVGDVNTPQPGFFDLRGKAKWTAWNEQKGKTQDAAKEEYVALINSLVAKYP